MRIIHRKSIKFDELNINNHKNKIHHDNQVIEKLLFGNKNNDNYNLDIEEDSNFLTNDEHDNQFELLPYEDDEYNFLTNDNDGMPQMPTSPKNQ